MNFYRYKEVEPGRLRESHGFLYEEIIVGLIVEHRPGRTVTEADNVWQSLLALNSHPLHIDNHYCENTQWGKPLVSSLVTLSIVAGMTVLSTSAKAVANLGWKNIELLSPVFIGDTLYAESVFLDKRMSETRTHEGVVTCETTGLNQDGKKVMRFTRSFLLPTKDHLLAKNDKY